jgi:hypothetical protein
MPQENMVTEISELDRQIRSELLGDWYNYEPDDTEPDSLRLNHWLDPLNESMKLPGSRQVV